MKELEVVLIDEVEYFVIKEAKQGDLSFLYLSNVDDPEDTLIRKIDNKDNPDMMLPLASEEEFELACNLFLNEIFAD